MTLEEAIKHCEQKACDNSECALEHRQLAKWLKQLQTLLRSNKAIEERAKEYAKGQWDLWNADIAKAAYITGATEQKAIDDAELSKLKSEWGNETQVNRRCYIKGYRDAVEKACKWFGDYLFDIGYPDDWMRDSQNLKSGEQRFRKAMGE